MAAPKGLEIVVVAHSLEFTVLAVQEKSLVGHKFDGADTKAGGISICKFSVGVDFRYSLI